MGQGRRARACLQFADPLLQRGAERWQRRERLEQRDRLRAELDVVTQSNILSQRLELGEGLGSDRRLRAEAARL